MCHIKKNINDWLVLALIIFDGCLSNSHGFYISHIVKIRAFPITLFNKQSYTKACFIMFSNGNSFLFSAINFFLINLFTLHSWSEYGKEYFPCTPYSLGKGRNYPVCLLSMIRLTALTTKQDGRRLYICHR